MVEIDYQDTGKKELKRVEDFGVDSLIIMEELRRVDGLRPLLKVGPDWA